MSRAGWRAAHAVLPGVCLLIVLVVAACGGGSQTSTGKAGASSAQPVVQPTTTPTTVPVVVIHTKTAKVGTKSETVLADVKGKTLYYFTPDSSSQAACTASCAALWPPLTVSGGAPASSPTLSGTLSVVNGANGTQVAYNGHPLYTYSKDEDSGDVYGEGVAGKWFVATPDLAK